jgi:alpha-glucuronidase
MRKKHYVSIQNALRSARPAWEAKYGQDAFDAMVAILEGFCATWASAAHPFDAERFRAEVYREGTQREEMKCTA